MDGQIAVSVNVAGAVRHHINTPPLLSRQAAVELQRSSSDHDRHPCEHSH
jgi:hypothetical protein